MKARDFPPVEKTKWDGEIVITPVELIERQTAVAYRTECITIALGLLGIPLTRFTHECLINYAENLDMLLTPKEEDL